MFFFFKLKPDLQSIQEKLETIKLGAPATEGDVTETEQEFTVSCLRILFRFAQEDDLINFVRMVREQPKRLETVMHLKHELALLGRSPQPPPELSEAQIQNAYKKFLALKNNSSMQ